VKVCFADDLFLGGDLLNVSMEGIADIPVFKEAEKRIVNLEQPISDNDDIADKCTLYTGSFAINQLQKMSIDAVNVAHNHIQDKGLDGIVETIYHLNKANIGHFGAGENIDEAKNPYWITEKIAVLGYCEFGKTYLSQIEIADLNKPGVNKLRYDEIINDLEKLKEGQKAILSFHWGREHVWFPPYDDIDLSRRLLGDDRVLAIIGTHAHRMQGYIEHNGKRAYMCLGNFLFPNFYIKPPTQIYYPEAPVHNYDITRQYHDVYKITYKKWRYVNRVSILLSFDTVTEKANHKFAYQYDNYPKVVELSRINAALFSLIIWFLSKIYNLPKYLYVPIEKINTATLNTLWRSQIVYFKVNQLGILDSLRKLALHVQRKMTDAK
jgi:poly-gamma-glutamate synthesis protein (capsule biosynthesis protein)